MAETEPGVGATYQSSVSPFFIDAKEIILTDTPSDHEKCQDFPGKTSSDFPIQVGIDKSNEISPEKYYDKDKRNNPILVTLPNFGDERAIHTAA